MDCSALTRRYEYLLATPPPRSPTSSPTTGATSRTRRWWGDDVLRFGNHRPLPQALQRAARQLRERAGHGPDFPFRLQLLGVRWPKSEQQYGHRAGCRATTGPQHTDRARGVEGAEGESRHLRTRLRGGFRGRRQRAGRRWAGRLRWSRRLRSACTASPAAHGLGGSGRAVGVGRHGAKVAGVRRSHLYWCGTSQSSAPLYA